MSEANGYSVLASFATKEEADVVVGALRASGVPAIVGNAHAASVDWTSVQALGGIQVLVPSAQRDEAREILNMSVETVAHDAEDDALPSLRRRDRGKAQLMLLWVAGPLVIGVAVAVVLMVWRALSPLLG